MSKNTVILIDGTNYLFRAFHALQDLHNQEGMPTGAIYGITNMLKSLIKDYQPVYAAIVFDSKESNFRHSLFPEYKANRAKTPDELSVQIPFSGAKAQPWHQLLGGSAARELSDGRTIKK